MSAQQTPAVTQAVALQAARWFFLLKSGDATATDRARWARWRAANPLHDQAWQRAEQVGQKFDQLPPALAMPVLGRKPQANRRAAVRALAVLLVAAPTGWLAWRAAPLDVWTADHHTATGEQRQMVLPDGSHIQLDTATAIDIDFDSSQRTLHLRSGAISITTSPDPAPRRRPFVVATTHGRLRALGTRFTVRQGDERSHVAVQVGAVEISPARSTRTVVVQAGEQAHFTAGHVGDVEAAGPQADAWTRGVLYARNMRLQDFAAELGRYRPGVLRCDPAVADLRVSGAFQLRDTTPVLDSLPQALPVDVLYRTRYWVTLLPPGGT